MSAWPNFAKLRQRTVQVVAHSRGVTPAAGFLEYELGRGARIVARVSVVPMVRQTAFAFRAWVHSLRGRGAFLFPLAKAGAADSTSTIYTDGTRFSDATPYADLTITTLSAGAAEGASALTVTGAHTAFVGRTFSYESWYQAVRRFWRFGQKRAVQVHLIVATGEESIGTVIDRKAGDHDNMKAAMRAAMMRNIGRKSHIRVPYLPTYTGSTPKWISAA